MGMKAYIVRRLIQGVFLFLGAITLSFVILQLAPGNYASRLIGNPNLTPEEIERLTILYGLDRSIYDQFLGFFMSALQGDFGISFHYNQPVMDIIALKAANTIFLSITSLILAIFISIPLGIVSGIKPYSKTDNFNTVISLVGFSMPVFWLALMLMMLFSTTFSPLASLNGGNAWLPLASMNSVDLIFEPIFALDIFNAKIIIMEPAWWFDRLQHMILPTFVLSFGSLAMMLRLTRASMIDVMSQDYIRTARAKGLPERSVVYSHGFRNARLPVVTIVGLNIAFILSGALITETLFSWPGMGRMAWNAILQRDWPLLMGTYIITSLMVIIMNIITDLTYAKLDPRITFT